MTCRPTVRHGPYPSSCFKWINSWRQWWTRPCGIFCHIFSIRLASQLNFPFSIRQSYGLSSLVVETFKKVSRPRPRLWPKISRPSPRRKGLEIETKTLQNGLESNNERQKCQVQKFTVVYAQQIRETRCFNMKICEKKQLGTIFITIARQRQPPVPLI